MRNAAFASIVITTAACASPTPVHELSYASIQDPSSSAVVTVGQASYAVLTYDVVPRGLGSCLPGSRCDHAEEIATMTEIYALGAAPMLVFSPQSRAYAAEIARSLQCPDVLDAHLDANFVGVGVDDFGAWQFFELCPRG